MGIHCCKDKNEEGPQKITKPVNYGTTYTCNNMDVFKTRPPCWYHHHCPCPCHHKGRRLVYFPIKI